MSRQRLSLSDSRAKLGLLIALTLLLLLPGSVLAQSYRGSIRGHVVDPSGRVLAGAKVTAKNSATGFTRETVTGGDGALRAGGTGRREDMWSWRRLQTSTRWRRT